MLADAEAHELIAGAYCGRVATIGSDGWPSVVPLLHVFTADVIGMRNTAPRGHFRETQGVSAGPFGSRRPECCPAADRPENTETRPGTPPATTARDRAT